MLPSAMPGAQEARRILIASNRGPISFVRGQDGRVEARRGQGGLVTALGGALGAFGGRWIASAMSEEDRLAAGRGRQAKAGSSGYSIRYLSFDRSVYADFYDGISNRILWFAHHMLWDLPQTPSFLGSSARWEAYRSVNQGFARALADEGGDAPGARYLVQDYHLALVPDMLRAIRPRARIAHFWHIPFAPAEYVAVLPRWMREEMLAGLLGADVVGFQAPAWAEHFLTCCRALPGAAVDARRRVVRWAGREVRVGVFPVSIDPDGLRSEATSAGVARAREGVLRLAGGRQLMVRVDRAELSKNILRGLLAFEALLEAEPVRRNEVTFLAHLNPTRTRLAEYRAYTLECRKAADRINRRFGRPGWAPVVMRMKDDHAGALAAYQLYDVLVVNPILDGMNLVAKEGPIVNERDGVLLLSETAGAFTELGRYALAVNPFDVEATGRLMGAALDMSGRERRRRARGLRAAINRNPIDRWISSQLEALDRPAT